MLSEIRERQIVYDFTYMALKKQQQQKKPLSSSKCSSWKGIQLQCSKQLDERVLQSSNRGLSGTPKYPLWVHCWGLKIRVW